MSIVEDYRLLGRRLFWRSILHGVTWGLLPRRFDPDGETWDRVGQLEAQEYLRCKTQHPTKREGEQ